MSAALVAVFGAAILAIALSGSGGDDGGDEDRQPRASQAAGEAPADAKVVRADSHRLGESARSKVTLTEFLDFECEACGAAYPAIEQLRKEYAGRVTFVMRYFPVPSHRNAQTAAVAVEAAARQGELEAMYKRMFETQQSWGEQSASKAGLFRTYAEDLGLDMRAFDAAVAAPATVQRVQRDQAEGAALGVQGTPTFFINDQLIQPQSIEDLRRLIDAALDA